MCSSLFFALRSTDVISGLTPLAVDSEVGQLRTVLLHRPGDELTRLTPRNNDKLLFDSIPWVARAQEEHDAFAEVLRSQEVEVLLLQQILQTALEDPQARAAGINAAVNHNRLGIELAEVVSSYLSGMTPEELTAALIAGLTFAEIPVSEGGSLVRAMIPPHEFAIDPLPNLLFTRDSSTWIGNRVTVSALAMPARHRETAILDVIYTHHPRFAGTARAYGAHSAPVEGGDIMVLSAGVLAVGVGERTTAAGAESLARALLREGTVHTVLAVPIAQTRATMHLDTVCTMVARDTMVMYPLAQDSLLAYTVRLSDAGPLEITGPRPFRTAAADALGLERLRIIDTGLDPVVAEREQWDDGNNTLAVAPGMVVAYERNTETNRRLEEAGIEVLRIAGSELGSGRGGPRCMSCPISRDPL